MMGPRIGRFDKHGRPVSMPGHSVPLSALGGLILIFGFFACNGTKQVNSVTKKLAQFYEKEAKTVAEPERPTYLSESLT